MNPVRARCSYTRRQENVSPLPHLENEWLGSGRHVDAVIKLRGNDEGKGAVWRKKARGQRPKRDDDWKGLYEILVVKGVRNKKATFRCTSRLGTLLR